MIKLSKGWLNTGQISWANDLGDEIVVFANGETRNYRGTDAQIIRRALDFESAENAAAMKRVEADRAEECASRLREKRVIAGVGEQTDGTFIAR